MATLENPATIFCQTWGRAPVQPQPISKSCSAGSQKCSQHTDARFQILDEGRPVEVCGFLSDFHVVKFQLDAKWRASHPRSASRGVLSPCLPRAKDAPSGWALSRDSRHRTPGRLSVLPKQKQQWTQLRMLSSAQWGLWDLLPRQLPGICKGAAAWLMVPHRRGHPKGELWEVGHGLSVPLLCWEGAPWPWGVPWMLPDQAFILQDSAMGFVPEKAVISKKWAPDLFTLYSLLLLSLKAMQDASHSYTHHQIVTAETIKMEVHPTFTDQALNPHVWIFLYLKLSIAFIGVLR